MWIAAQFPDRFQSIASIHGANMATDAPDSPHLMPPQIKCESYFACAEIDKWAPPADIQKLESSLLQAKSKFRIEWYPKVEHGFVFPQRAGMYNAQAAERHWERLFELFGRTLKSSWFQILVAASFLRLAKITAELMPVNTRMGQSHVQIMIQKVRPSRTEACSGFFSLSGPSLNRCRLEKVANPKQIPRNKYKSITICS